jgi:signal transduction histidine kinase
MTTMRERAEAVGATLTIHSIPGHGTRVEAALSKDAA